MTIRTLIVDDEPHAIDIVKRYSANIPEIEIVDTCHNAIKAFQTIQHNKIDLLFLDVKMPGLSGTDLARSLKNPPLIIFTTAFQDYAVEGFDLNAVDYLLKPIAFDRFLRAIDKVMSLVKKENKPLQQVEKISATNKNNQYLYLRIERQLVKVNTADICWIESIKDYIKVVTKTKKFITKQKISVAENLLPIGEFMRIHRSYIVPLNKIESHHANYVVIDGNKIPIGRNYKPAILQKLNSGEANII